MRSKSFGNYPSPFNFSTPNSHKLYANSLRKAITEHASEKMPQEKIKKLLAQLNPDSNGEIDFSGFVNIMTLS